MSFDLLDKALNILIVTIIIFFTIETALLIYFILKWAFA